jgi:hypothetical protein
VGATELACPFSAVTTIPQLVNAVLEEGVVGIDHGAVTVAPCALFPTVPDAGSSFIHAATISAMIAVPFHASWPLRTTSTIGICS